MTLGTLFAVATAIAVVMQSFVVGSVRYTPTEKPLSFWVGVGILGLLAVVFYFVGLRDRQEKG